MTAVKIILLGDEKAGKSELLKRFVNDKAYDNNYKPTIGVDFIVKNNCSKKIADLSIQIWDTAGNQSISYINLSYRRGADVILYCVDLSKEHIDSENIKKKIQELNEQNPAVPVILVGTKSDCCPEAAERLAAFCVDDQRSIATSALDGTGVEDLFSMMVSYAEERVPAPIEKSVKASSLSEHQLDAINTQIDKLRKEMQSCLPIPHINRKRDKVRALENLILETNTMSVADAKAKVESKFPVVRKGFFSTRTATLLDSLKDEKVEKMSL